MANIKRLNPKVTLQLADIVKYLETKFEEPKTRSDDNEYPNGIVYRDRRHIVGFTTFTLQMRRNRKPGSVLIDSTSILPEHDDDATFGIMIDYLVEVYVKTAGHSLWAVLKEDDLESQVKFRDCFKPHGSVAYTFNRIAEAPFDSRTRARVLNAMRPEHYLLGIWNPQTKTDPVGGKTTVRRSR
jgi:hypothetical protein